ncbi:ethylmalonyl-CoA decarboxylase [Aplysia californica]|uniref:Ethylmalonyl-CoA decarboxylase n=1 Tax=Aplysia californica TaxID=6500 RepID=A0ABM1A080_APLCA|nr:ethylmalonyl-CoA decarboxylase [Aplysia californica]XP_012938176.1 ethylmalonyl-CoA decarboxylase [Aplysia californica]
MCTRATNKVLHGVLKQLKSQSNVTFARSVYYLNRPNLQPIRTQLATFEGGSVELEMDNSSGIAVLTLSNPRRLNSMTGKMMVDMADCVGELELWKEGKGLIMCGEGGNLCSGGDLTFVRKALHYGEEMAAYQHDTLTRLLNLPLISVALVQGHTLGGGAELSTACDYRVMSPSAKIGFVQIKMGLTTAWGAATRLTRLLGRRKAIDLLCSARILLPSAAFHEGLVDYVIPRICDDELQETKNWLMRNFCNYDTSIMRAIKSLVVNADLSMDMSVALDNERKLFAQTWGGPVQRKALDANIKHK